jgi:hypothetical protein
LHKLYVISGFRRRVNEILALLDVTQLRWVATDVSGQSIGSIIMNQAVQEEYDA